MSLNYDLRSVKLFQEKKARQEHEEETNSKETPFWEADEWDVLESIVFATLSTNIGEITEDNAREFVVRHLLCNRVLGFPPSPYITHENVKKFVGLCTNVPTLTRAQWLSHGAIISMLRRTLETEVEHDLSNNAHR